MSANIKSFKIALGISNPYFWTNRVKRNFRCLHSYLDPLVLKVALIYGPTCDQVCTHIWTIPIYNTILVILNLHSKILSAMEREVTNGHVSGKNISPFIIGNFSGEILESYSLYMKGTISNFAFILNEKSTTLHFNQKILSVLYQSLSRQFNVC